MTKYVEPNFPAIFTQNYLNLRQFDKDLIAVLGLWNQNFLGILDSGISFADNMDVSLVSYTSNAIAGTEDTIAHGLGKTPTGYIVYRKNKAADVYDGGTANDKTNLHLKCSVASATIYLMVF